MTEAKLSTENWKIRHKQDEVNIFIDHEREVNVISFEGKRNDELITMAKSFIEDLCLNYTIQYA